MMQMEDRMCLIIKCKLRIDEHKPEQPVGKKGEKAGGARKGGDRAAAHEQLKEALS
jgi:hypothetical protein